MESSRLALVLVFLGSQILPMRLQAQGWQDQVKDGTRIVVTIQAPSQQFPRAKQSALVGILDHRSADSIHLRTVDSLPLVSVPLRLVAGVKVSHGFMPPAASAARRGALLGGAGVLYFVLFNGMTENRRLSTESAAITGGVSGMVLGIVLGLLQPHERWERLTVVPLTSGGRTSGAMITYRW